MAKSLRSVGLHVSVAGGLARAEARALEAGCSALQIFPSNPRGWALPNPDTTAEAKLADACAQRGWPLFVHAPYLVNLASPDPVVHERSRANLSFALARSARLGARAVVVHAGSAVGTDRDAARRRAASAIQALLDEHAGIDLAIELTAGGGERALARSIPNAAEMLAACGDDDRVGVCIDTCHLWAAGLDWTTSGGLAQLRRDVRELGPDRILVVHVNDSHDPFGSSRDHHANLGDGRIGVEPFGAFVRAREWRHAPLVLETPGTDERRAHDVDIVRSLLGE